MGQCAPHIRRVPRIIRQKPSPEAVYATLSSDSRLLNLRHGRTILIFHKQMRSEPTAAGLRTLRKKSGLSQIQLARILGFESAIPVAQHERSQAVPNLLTALAYEVIFQTPISAQFRGLYTSVEVAIEERLADFERQLHQSDVKGRGAASVARMLEFLTMRRESQSNNELNEAQNL